MIVVTGAAGFIGSCLIKGLNQESIVDVIAVDKFGDPQKEKNLRDLRIAQRIDRDEFFTWFDQHANEVKFVYHIGAKTDTAEFDVALLHRMNTAYTQAVWQRCTQHHIPLVYASSAATYGLGEHGYEDDEKQIPLLKPLNPYGQSKQDFDVWALQQTSTPPAWAGLKFFNVYGPNEYHKGRMASVIWHAFNQISKTGKMKLFRSHHPDFRDGEQMRDFVYVKDVVDVCLFLMKQKSVHGIFNLGSGKARTFVDLTHAVFKAMGKPEVIEFIDTPADIRDKYQYFTEATMQKLAKAGYAQSFHSLEAGVEDYVKNYLLRDLKSF